MSKWLERASREFSEKPDQGAAKRAVRTLMAATAAPKPAVSEKKEVPTCFNCGAVMTATTDHGKPCWECRSCAVGDGTANPDGIAGDGASVVDQIIENGEIIAALICSKILEAHIWVSLKDDFAPKDGRAVFYAAELETLKGKTVAELREIHKVKLAFGPGSQVRQ
jgi:hypothetical protein